MHWGYIRILCILPVILLFIHICSWKRDEKLAVFLPLFAVIRKIKTTFGNIRLCETFDSVKHVVELDFEKEARGVHFVLFVEPKRIRQV